MSTPSPRYNETCGGHEVFHCTALCRAKTSELDMAPQRKNTNTSKSTQDLYAPIWKEIQMAALEPYESTPTQDLGSEASSKNEGVSVDVEAIALASGCVHLTFGHVSKTGELQSWARCLFPLPW